jgi:hypothetical protein
MMSEQVCIISSAKPENVHKKTIDCFMELPCTLAASKSGILWLVIHVQAVDLTFIELGSFNDARVRRERSTHSNMSGVLVFKEFAA